jgi:DNA-binding MarR family transcriptional regulator/predicted GNAT family N-acyltransferase
MDRAFIDRVRSFHRTVTQRVGALNDAYLSRDRPLGQARVLWEIGSDGCDVRALRQRLDLDSGYLSRLLRGLETDGLVAVEANGSDGRVRTARLTEAGLAERRVLDKRSDDLAADILSALSAQQRKRLVAAMGEVERLLMASMVVIAPVDSAHPHLRQCVAEYVAELDARLDGGFDPRNSLQVEDDELVPPGGVMLVATLHEDPVACGALRLHRDAPAEIKRVWVSPDVRGLGLGRRVLHELESYAATHGALAARLETNRNLTEAISLYRANGYREVDPFNDEPYAHHWFEKTLEPVRRKVGE